MCDYQDEDEVFKPILNACIAAVGLAFGVVGAIFIMLALPTLTSPAERRMGIFVFWGCVAVIIAALIVLARLNVRERIARLTGW